MVRQSMLRPVEDKLADVLNQRRRRDAELRPTRVEGRNADGTVNMRRLDGECIARSNICALQEGQIVDSPCAAPFKLAGAAGISTVRSSRNRSSLWVEDIEPSMLWPGYSDDVTITGRGFTATTVFEFLVPGTETVNDDITINSQTLVSDTEYTLNITVAGDATLIDADAGDIAYDDPSLP